MKALIAFLLMTCGAFAGAPPSEPYTREVIVPEAGWYRIPVDGHIWRHACGRVLAFDKSGKILPCGILPVEVPSPAAEEAQPQLLRVEEEGDHLVLYLHVDRLAGRHDRLIVDFGGADILQSVTLWGSMDEKAWTPMTKGSLFRLGSVERMQGSALDYPHSGFDHLKLVLPRGDQAMKMNIREFRVGNIRLHYSPDDTISPWMDETVGVRPADPALVEALAGDEETLLQLDLPVGFFPAQRIDLTLDRPHAPLPISILKMDRGIPYWEYSCTLDTDAQSIPVPGGRLETPAFIKLHRERDILNQVVVQRPREEIILFADKPGIVTLIYGGAEERPMAFPPVRRQKESREAALGPVVEHPIALALSPELIKLASKAPERKFKPLLQWSLALPYEAVPGQWMAVELIPELLSAGLNAGTGRWGIACGGQVVASFQRVDPMPVPVRKGSVKLEPDRAFPMQASTETIWSNLQLPVWLAVKVHAHGEPVKVMVEMPLSSSALKRVPPGSSTRPWRIAGVAMIECGPWTNDCLAVVNCTSLPAGKALITLEGKNLPPPEYMQTSVWRVRQFLVFPVAAAGDLRLFYGTPEQEAWEALGRYIAMDLLPGYLPKAKVGALVGRNANKPSWEQPLFYGALVLAAGVLLLLIVRLLPKKEG